MQDTYAEETPILETGRTDGLKVVTLGELGPRLPLGVVDAAGDLHRDIEFRPWTGKVMRELGKMRDESRELTMPEHVGLVLSAMAVRLGQHDFTKLERKDKKLAVSQMFMGDVFYAYCYARVQALGPQLVLNLVCPTCRAEFKFEADLNELTVVTADSLDAAYWKYTLQIPTTIRGQDVAELSMGAARWFSVENAQTEGQYDVEGGKLAVVAGCIRGPVGREQFPLSQREVDELSGRDIEAIVAELDGHYVGPDMRIDTECPNKRCKTRITQPIDWGYQRFFGASSRYRPSGRSTTGSSPSLSSPREQLPGT